MSDFGFPLAFEERMRKDLREKWQEFALAHNLAAPTSIRVNPAKINNVGNYSRIPWTSNGFYLDERPSFTLDPAFHAGSYYVQEASSMFVEQAFLQSVDQAKSLNVLDLCAAPGGKSTHLLSLINEQSLLVSNEVIRSRASVLTENIQKWGYDNVVVTNNDPQDFQRLSGFFDVVVVDAPCSGEGLFRKEPHAMEQWSPENVALCSKRQRRILSDIWPALKPGGILIYSTCTYNQSENEENLEWLRKQHEVEFIHLELDENWGVQVVDEAVVHGYRLFPHSVKGEGFFLSVMRKTEGTENKMKHKNSFTGPSKKIVEQLDRWILHPEEKTFIIRNGVIQFFPRAKTAEIALLANNTHIITAGTIMASVKHDKLVPEHPSALSIGINKENFNLVEVDLDEALQFLRKETMKVLSGKKGFSLIHYKNLPLGWVNVLDNRMNNLYPSEWRIRMTDKLHQ